MKTIWTITKRELSSFFDSLTAYILLILFLGLSGFFTWLYGSDVFFVGQASLRSFFGIAYWTLFFFIPALTMRLIADEKKTGTIELLLTKSVSDRQFIIGKFFAAFILIIIALASTLSYIITIANIGNLDNGAVIFGYFGLALMSATYISIGIFAGSFTNNQIVAFLISLFIGLFFHIIFGILANNFTGITGNILNYLSISGHFESISRGVVDLSDIVYFLSIIFLSLFTAELFIRKRNFN